MYDLIVALFGVYVLIYSNFAVQNRTNDNEKGT